MPSYFPPACGPTEERVAKNTSSLSAADGGYNKWLGSRVGSHEAENPRNGKSGIMNSSSNPPTISVKKRQHGLWAQKLHWPWTECTVSGTACSSSLSSPSHHCCSCSEEWWLMCRQGHFLYWPGALAPQDRSASISQNHSTSAISRWICYFRVTNLLYCILVQQDSPPSQVMQGEDGLLQFHSGPGPLSSRFWSRMQSREDSLLRGKQHTVDWYSRPTPQESSQRHRQTRCYCNNTACLNETLLPTWVSGCFGGLM